VEKQVLISNELIIFRCDRRSIKALDNLLPTEMWSTSPEGFNHSNIGFVGPGTRS
jgi:hypothetical protein